MKTTILASTSILTLLVLLLPGCSQSQPHGDSTEGPPLKDGVLLHISHGAEHPHRVSMALKMANVMADDKDVLLYFDIKGVEVVLKEASAINLEPFDSASSQIESLLEKGVGLSVCPSCLAAAGKSQEDVLEGVKIANKEAFFGFTKGRILTLDY